MLNNITSQKAEHFEDLLENYESRNVRQGEVVTGTIVYMEADVAYIDIGAKTDAIVPASDLGTLDRNMRNALSTGDEVKVYITQTPARGGELIVSIERGLEALDWEKASKMILSGEIGEYRVKNINRGGVLVEFGRLSGFVPNSHLIELRRQPKKDLENLKTNLIGEILSLKVIDVDQSRRRLVLSELGAQDELKKQRLRDIQLGDIVSGHVVSIAPYGVFVDIGDIDGLIHISNLDWNQVNHPEEIIQEGQEVEVKIINIDLDKERISLSRKALLPNPWTTFDKDNSVGDLVEGIVVRVAEFGAFVQLKESIIGLVHVSEMGDYGTRSPNDVFKPGDKVLVRILEIDMDRERVGLSTRKVTREETFDWMESDTNTTLQD